MRLCRYISIALVFTCFTDGFSQISPPGLDETNAAFWSAVAINQQLSRWTLGFYVGAARKSDPDNVSLFKKPAIFVVNEEIAFQVNKRWSVAFCASYRSQNEYEKTAPYLVEDPSSKIEDRFYMRFYYRETLWKIPFVFSFRPELRLYFGEHGHTWNPVDEELRFRFKGQAMIPLDDVRSNHFVIGNEILTTTDHEKGKVAEHWTAYNFSEDRISTYFRHKFNPHVTADVGVMQQIKHDGGYVAQLSVDLLFTNLFSKKAG